MQVRKLSEAEAVRLLSSCDSPAGAVSDSNVTPRSTEELRLILNNIFVRFSAVDSIPDYETIAIPRFRVAVSQSVCEGMVSRYTSLYSKYVEKGGQTSAVKGPEQIATLLGT